MSVIDEFAKKISQKKSPKTKSPLTPAFLGISPDIETNDKVNMDNMDEKNETKSDKPSSIKNSSVVEGPEIEIDTNSPPVITYTYDPATNTTLKETVVRPFTTPLYERLDGNITGQ